VIFENDADHVIGIVGEPGSGKHYTLIGADMNKLSSQTNEQVFSPPAGEYSLPYFEEDSFSE